MHVSTVLAAALVAVSSTMANPAMRRNVPPVLCAGTLENTPECCATDVLGLADLDCAPPPKVPSSDEDFVSICASIGQRARCCVLGTLGQGLVCQAPPG